MNSERKEKFTPGPWCAIGTDISPSFNTFFTVATVSSWDYGEEEYGANAALIAAAPEMYELLDCIRKSVALDSGIMASCIARIEPLLKKARGEA